MKNSIIKSKDICKWRHRLAQIILTYTQWYIQNGSKFIVGIFINEYFQFTEVNYVNRNSKAAFLLTKNIYATPGIISYRNSSSSNYETENSLKLFAMYLMSNALSFRHSCHFGLHTDIKMLWAWVKLENANFHYDSVFSIFGKYGTHQLEILNFLKPMLCYVLLDSVH